MIHEAISFHRLGELTVPSGKLPFLLSVSTLSLIAVQVIAFVFLYLLVSPRETPKIESLSLKFDRPTTSDISDPIRLAKESVTHLATTLARYYSLVYSNLVSLYFEISAGLADGNYVLNKRRWLGEIQRVILSLPAFIAELNDPSIFSQL